MDRMNPQSRTNKNDDKENNNNNYNIRTEPIATVLPLAGIILVSTGLFSLIGSGYFQVATAQQNMTTNDAIATDATRT